jgi:uncharacterized protein YecA (UPF0149 family)
MVISASKKRMPIHPAFDPQEMRDVQVVMSNVDGMITAIAIGPERIPPAEWLPKVGFGPAGPTNLDPQRNELAK